MHAMRRRRGGRGSLGVPASRQTWNTPEAIAKHRAMSPEQRLRKTIALSQAALRFAHAERVDER